MEPVVGDWQLAEGDRCTPGGMGSLSALDSTWGLSRFPLSLKLRCSQSKNFVSKVAEVQIFQAPDSLLNT